MSKGKANQDVIQIKAKKSSTKALSLLHMDLFGPGEPLSVSDKKYTLVVVDDHTRYTWIVFVNKNNNAQQKCNIYWNNYRTRRPSAFKR